MKLCPCPEWPDRRFSGFGTLLEAKELASAVHCLGHAGTCNRITKPLRIASSLSIEVTHKKLGGSLEALLIPLDVGSFKIIVNTRLPERLRQLNPLINRRKLLAVQQAVCIAHELAHTFFFRWSPFSSQPPNRVHPISYGRTGQCEEVWCDTFAHQLLSLNRPAEEQALLDLAVWEGRSTSYPS